MAVLGGVSSLNARLWCSADQNSELQTRTLTLPLGVCLVGVLCACELWHVTVWPLAGMGRIAVGCALGGFGGVGGGRKICTRQGS